MTGEPKRLGQVDASSLFFTDDEQNNSLKLTLENMVVDLVVSLGQS